MKRPRATPVFHENHGLDPASAEKETRFQAHLWLGHAWLWLWLVYIAQLVAKEITP